MGTNLRSLTVDAVDRLIIDQLRIDGRQSFGAVGDKIGLSEPTVRTRYNRLVKLGIMQVVGMVSQTKLGEITILGFLSVIGRDIDSLCEELYKIPEIVYIAQSVGEFDLCIDIRCIDEDHRKITMALISEIRGISKSEFHSIREVLRERYLWQGLTN